MDIMNNLYLTTNYSFKFVIILMILMKTNDKLLTTYLYKICWFGIVNTVNCELKLIFRKLYVL